jgi:hypothetical protein
MTESGLSQAELIKWWDAYDAILGVWKLRDMEHGFRLARSCRHPDALWLCALFPAGEVPSLRELEAAMLAEAHDVRAMTIAGPFGETFLCCFAQPRWAMCRPRRHWRALGERRSAECGQRKQWQEAIATLWAPWGGAC